MSESSGLNLKEQIARIDRSIAEGAKLQAETNKFVAEQRKLIAESEKLNRDRLVAPWITAGGFVGGMVTLTALILRALGVLQ